MRQESVVEDDIRRQLLAKSKKKGLEKRVSVAGDNDDDEDDFTPQFFSKSQTDQDLINLNLLVLVFFLCCCINSAF